MNADEIIKALRKECNDCSERCSCDAGHPLLYCPNREAADLITSQQAEIDRLTALDKEAVELIESAENDVKSICKFCTHQLASKRCTKCTSEHWKWQHADRYKALKKKMEG